MTVKENWIKLGIILAGVFSLIYILNGVFLSEDSLSIIFIIIMYIGMMAHLFGNFRVLYQFAITRHRMSNRLHFYNRLLVGVSFAGGFIYLLLLAVMKHTFNETPHIGYSISLLLIMFINIVYQENNTQTFIKKFPIRIKNRQRKSFNQLVGLMTSSLIILFIWSLGITSIGLSGAGFCFGILIIMQNGLSYTTYGQSRYWNFVYEVLFIVTIAGIGLQQDLIILKVLAGLLGLVFAIRQWKMLEYKKLSIFIGFILYVALVSLMMIDIFKVDFTTYDESSVLIIPSLAVAIVFVLTYIIDQPKFYKRLFKQ